MGWRIFLLLGSLMGLPVQQLFRLGARWCICWRWWSWGLRWGLRFQSGSLLERAIRKGLLYLWEIRWFCLWGFLWCWRFCFCFLWSRLLPWCLHLRRLCQERQLIWRSVFSGFLLLRRIMWSVRFSADWGILKVQCISSQLHVRWILYWIICLSDFSIWELPVLRLAQHFPKRAVFCLHWLPLNVSKPDFLFPETVSAHRKKRLAKFWILGFR